MITNLSGFEPLLQELGWPNPTCLRGSWMECGSGMEAEVWTLESICVYWDLRHDRRLFVDIYPFHGKGDWSVSDFGRPTLSTQEIEPQEGYAILAKEKPLGLGPNFVNLNLDQMVRFLRGERVYADESG